MAETLSDPQRKINTNIKRLDKNAKAFTAQKFRTDERAKKLDRIYSDYLYNPKKRLTTEKFLEVKEEEAKLLCEVVGKPYNYESALDVILENEFYDATANIFKIYSNDNKPKAIIEDISDARYYHASLAPHTDSPDSYIKARVKKWVNYCTTINQCIKFVNQEFEDWNALPNKKRDIYINHLKNISKATFMHDAQNLLHYIDFLDNYQLRQTDKAKADFLLKQKLPNIDAYDTALKVVKQSSLCNFLSNQ